MSFGPKGELPADGSNGRVAAARVNKMSLACCSGLTSCWELCSNRFVCSDGWAGNRQIPHLFLVCIRYHSTPEDEIEARVQDLRERLTKRLQEGQDVGGGRGSGKPDLRRTHESAHAKEAEMQRLARAFGVDPSREEGSSFHRRQEREQRAQEEGKELLEHPATLFVCLHFTQTSSNLP